MDTFLICPVRGHDMAETEALVKSLEADGWDVYWPPRDTPQDDPTGYNICRNNEAAIRARRYVHFVWDGKSQGGLFDLGMAFAMGKTIIPVQMPPLTTGKSFQNMVSEWARQR